MARHADDTRNRGVAGWIIGSVGRRRGAGRRRHRLLRLPAQRRVGRGRHRLYRARRPSRWSPVRRLPRCPRSPTPTTPTRPAARGTCVSVQVSALSSAETVDALLAGWTNQAVPQPAVWVADTAPTSPRSRPARPSLVAGHSETVWATSPVVLAVTAPGGRLRCPTDLAWADLPTATDGDRRASRSPATVGSAWRSADPRTDLGTSFALESVIGSAAVRCSPIRWQRPPVRSPTLAGNSARTDGHRRAARRPVVRIRRVHRASGAGDPGHGVRRVRRQRGSLRAVYPSGPTVSAELLPIALTAPWLDRTQIDAATTFLAYLRSAPASTAAAGRRLADADRHAARRVRRHRPNGGDSPHSPPPAPTCGRRWPWRSACPRRRPGRRRPRRPDQGPERHGRGDAGGPADDRIEPRLRARAERGQFCQGSAPVAQPDDAADQLTAARPPGSDSPGPASPAG